MTVMINNNIHNIYLSNKDKETIIGIFFTGSNTQQVSICTIYPVMKDLLIGLSKTKMMKDLYDI